MLPKIFYRIEKNGSGPYTDDSWMETDHIDENHPGPRCDNAKDYSMKLYGAITEIFNNSSDSLYAFESVEMFLDWFSLNEVKNLIDLGYKIIKVTSLFYVLGEKQAVFHKNRFQILDSISTWEDFEARILDF